MNLKKIYAVSAAKTKKFLKSQGFQRVMMFAVLFILGTAFCIAAPSAASVGQKIGEAGTTIAGYVEPVQKVIYGIAGVVSLMGAISIYIKMNNGDQDVKKSLMMVVGGVVALVSMAEALPKIFG